MTINKNVTENEIILGVEGWLDTQASPELSKEIEELQLQDKTLVLDLQKLEYISSSGVRQIFAAHKKAKGKLIIRNTPANIFNIFSATGMDKRVNFE